MFWIFSIFHMFRVWCSWLPLDWLSYATHNTTHNTSQHNVTQNAIPRPSRRLLIVIETDFTIIARSTKQHYETSHPLTWISAQGHFGAHWTLNGGPTSEFFSKKIKIQLEKWNPIIGLGKIWFVDRIAIPKEDVLKYLKEVVAWYLLQF